MKKEFYLFLFLSGLFFTSCENPHPSVNNGVNQVVLAVGDSTSISVDNARQVKYIYCQSRKESIPVFEISNFEGAFTQIYGVNPGEDSLIVRYHWTKSIYAYEEEELIIVKVLEK